MSYWIIPWTKEPGRLQSMGSQSWTRLKQLSMRARMSGTTNKKSKGKVRLEVTSKREMELLLRMDR